jgi:type I protein arginine methyltransferase
VTYQVFDEHLAYWTDEVKIDRYRRALAHAVTAGATVLDLGSGTGLLGLLACEAGAGKVYAVEAGPMASVAAAVFERNGVADRVEVIRAHSTDVWLPEPVDVVVGDQIGGFAYTAGVLDSYADAVERLLRPGGVTVPLGFELLLAPVEHPPARASVEPLVRRIAGYDLSPIHELVQHTMRVVYLEDVNSLLSPPTVVRTSTAADASRFEAVASFRISRDGWFDGLVGMFIATMSPGVQMSNVPGHPDKLQRRWQDLFPLSRSHAVKVDDIVSVHVMVNPSTYLAVWRVTIQSNGVTTLTERHSTFEGQLLDPVELKLLAGQKVPISPLGHAVAAAIAGTANELDPAALSAQIATAFPNRQRSEIDRMVRRIAKVVAAES